MKHTIVLAAVLLLLCVSTGWGQTDTTWAGWHWLIGEWVGEGSGAPGEGSGGFSFTPALGGRVLIRNGHTSFPETQGRAAFTHEDLLIVSPGHGAQPGRGAYYDNEGHMIDYGVNVSSHVIVLTSTSAPGVPAYRLTYAWVDEKTVKVTFAVAPDGSHFRTYLDANCRKVK